MTWIETIAYADAKGRLRKLYDRIKGPDDNVDNIMLAHSLRPHSLEGHMTLYKYVLHHPGNSVPKWFLEALGVQTSRHNRCDYCSEHHFAGMARLLDDPNRAATIAAAFDSGNLDSAFTPKEVAALRYAAKLNGSPGDMAATDIADLRAAGWPDGEILEINQVVAYFGYANRTVLGLGIDTEGDVLGLSPGDSSDPDNWQHG